MYVEVSDLKEMWWGSFIDAICISELRQGIELKHQFKLTFFKLQKIMEPNVQTEASLISFW
jgi:hypothetical protein